MTLKTSPCKPPWLNTVKDTSPMELPENHDYGFCTEEGLFYCSKNDLTDYIANDVHKEIIYVWTPAATHPVSPEEISFLHQAVYDCRKKINKGLLKKSLKDFGIYSGFLLFYFVIQQKIDYIPVILWLVFAFIPLIENIIDQWCLSGMLPEIFAMQTKKDNQFYQWMSCKKNKWSYHLVFFMACVGIVQLGAEFFYRHHDYLSPVPVLSAGLYRIAVSEGQLWRIFTAPWLHGDLFHFFINAIALYYLSKLVEKLTNRYLLLILFTCSAITGSIVSLAFSNANNSIGISGGVLGLFSFSCFFIIMNYRNIPKNILHSIMINIGLFISFSMILSSELDHWGHAGGGIIGVIVGFFYYMSQKNKSGIDFSSFSEWPGKIAYIITMIIVVASSVVLIRSQNSVFTFKKATHYIDEKNWIQAKTILDEVIEKDKYYGVACLIRGDVHYQMMDYASATDDYMRVTQLIPYSSIGYSKAGWVLILQGKINESLIMMEKAYAIDNSETNIIINLGHSNLLSGNLEKSIFYYKQIPELLTNKKLVKLFRNDIRLFIDNKWSVDDCKRVLRWLERYCANMDK